MIKIKCIAEMKFGNLVEVNMSIKKEVSKGYEITGTSFEGRVKTVLNKAKWHILYGIVCCRYAYLYPSYLYNNYTKHLKGKKE